MNDNRAGRVLALAFFTVAIGLFLWQLDRIATMGCQAGSASIASGVAFGLAAGFALSNVLAEFLPWDPRGQSPER